MDRPMLELKGLQKRFGALVVTDRVDLSVRPGELHAIIGPNGAGKTSLVNQISGAMQADGGRVFLDGADITRLSMTGRAQLGMARSFQLTSILPEFSAEENVALAAQARLGSSFRFFAPAAREEELNAAAVAALEQVGLAGKRRVPAGALSHGEKRSLEIAMILAAEPKLILLDEPLAGTGQEDSERLISLFDGMKGHYAILLIEHDMQAVFALADRISVLVYGRIIASGTPEMIRADAGVRAAYLGEEEIG